MRVTDYGVPSPLSGEGEVTVTVLDRNDPPALADATRSAPEDIAGGVGVFQCLVHRASLLSSLLGMVRSSAFLSVSPLK